jgi:DNA repair exonuclease SbcCD nuclease subunit
MKFVLFSDLHLDAPFVGLGPEVANRRRQALRDTLRNITELAIRAGADALLCGGDLYEHESFTDDTMQFVRSTFAELPMPVFIAPGNHDWYGRTSMYQRADWPGNVHVFSTASLTPVPLAEGVTLWGAAHCMPAGTPGFLDGGFRVEGNGIHLALFHGSERGWFQAQGEGKDPHAPFDERQIMAAELDHAFLGHYHKAKDGPHHTYPGNPCPLSFGEDTGRGAVVVTLQPDGGVQRERFQVAAYIVHDLSIDVTGSASQQDIRDRLTGTLAGLTGCARVQLIGEVGPEVALNHLSADLLQGGLDRLVLSLDGVRVAYDFESIEQEPTVRGEFVRNVMADDLDEGERQRILITGLRALDGRTDLEVS